LATPQEYFAAFDAVADQYDGSDVTQNEQHKTLANWYVDGTLKLRGFYFAAPRPQNLSYLLTSVVTPPALIGYAHTDSGLLRFTEEPNGGATFATFVCPRGASTSVESPGMFVDEILLAPPIDSSTRHMEVLLMLVPTSLDPAASILTGVGCTLHEQRRGALGSVDPLVLLDNLTRNDLPITFYRSFGDVRASTSLRSDPEIPRLHQPAAIQVQVHTRDSDVKSVTLSINEAIGAETDGTWEQVGWLPVSSGRDATLTFDWHDPAVPPGEHRVAINVELTDGTTLWWYDQDPISITVAP
jgi:hypothetical protein